MKIYISEESLNRIDKGCGLGDSVRVPVLMYPHNADLPDLVAIEVDYKPGDPFWDKSARRPEETKSDDPFTANCGCPETWARRHGIDSRIKCKAVSGELSSECHCECHNPPSPVKTTKIAPAMEAAGRGRARADDISVGASEGGRSRPISKKDE